MLRRYVEVVEGFDIELVEAGVSICLGGELPGYDGRFAPTPPMFATACRMAADRRQRRARIENLSAPRLPAPLVEHTPESRQRIRAMAQQAADALAAVNAGEAVEEAERNRERWEKVNARFQPDMAPDAVMDRLMRRRSYDIGAPESDENAA